MSRRRDLAQLADLAQVVLDHRLGLLRASADQLGQSRMRLDCINLASMQGDLDPLMSARVGFEYERWADVRRAELNLVIARQTAAWQETRSETQTAFARVQALNGLANRVKADR